MYFVVYIGMFKLHLLLGFLYTVKLVRLVILFHDPQIKPINTYTNELQIEVTSFLGHSEYEIRNSDSDCVCNFY